MQYLYRIPFLVLLAAVFAAGCDSQEPVFDSRPDNFTLKDIDGESFTLQSTQGKVVLLTFFAPWCPHCQEEAPVLAELHEAYAAKDFLVVGVAVQADSLGQIRQFRDGLDLPYRILVDDGRVSSPVGYNVREVPTTYVIDRAVKLHGPYGHLTKEQWTDVLKPLL